ncbi:kinetochore-associated Ndc80 complex subunit ndc80 [Malassezia yamatoensis]|uniref:Kinetochore protein NDC80 n=1 Tax=Malassezia yamatoensis TaxID=253288 RepID=A0AAJ5YWE4_9BASI|nr:kinetochore-associated Ndc80 complex subunit ndc80 [Malassezia yamatoensis]
MEARRGTLEALDPNQGASTSRQTSKGYAQTVNGPRMSLAPPVSGVGPRMSLAPRMSTVGSRRTSVVSTSPRRRSIAGRRSVAGRMSLAPSAAPLMKDTRMRMKNARGVMETNLTQFLEQTAFSMAGWTPKLVHEPTQSAFVAMFRHVYRECIDETYVLGGENKKFEEEVMQLLRDIRYPFLEDLTKTKLMAAGSQANWPACLAMLDWIVRLGNGVNPLGSGPLERQDENEFHALFFPFLWRCYAKFWDNQDTYPEDTAALQTSFQQKNAQLEKQVESLEKAQLHWNTELSNLTAKPSPLQREQREHDVLQGDLIKFAQYHDEVLAPKLDKTRRAITRLQTSITEVEQELDQKRTERSRRQALVDAQDISAEEFEQMSEERQNLAQQLETFAQKHQQNVELCWKRELDFTRRQSDIEKRMASLELAAKRIEMWPIRTSYGVLEKLFLDPNHLPTMLPHGFQLDQFLAEVEQARNSQANRFRTLSMERSTQQEASDQLMERLNELRRQRRSVEARLEFLRDQLQHTQQTISEEEQVADAEIQRQEELVQTIQHTSHVALQQAEARKATAELQLQEAIASTEAERAAMHDEMCNVLHTLLDLKVRVAEGLDTISTAISSSCLSKDHDSP